MVRRETVRLAAKEVAEVAGRTLRQLIRAYRRYVSPLLGRHCRFYPSCSVYATQAIARHGVGRGGLLAVKRLLRCHPFHPGGVDPVPDVTPGTGSLSRGAMSPPAASRRGRSPAEGSLLRGAGPSRSPAEGSFMRGAGPSRSPAEGS